MLVHNLRNTKIRLFFELAILCDKLFLILGVDFQLIIFFEKRAAEGVGEGGVE